MLSDEEDLGPALRDGLSTLAADVEPSAKLLDQIEAIAGGPGTPMTGASPTRERSRWRERLGARRRILIAVTIPIAALLTTTIVLLGSSTPAPSDASGMRMLPNGNVVISFQQIMNVASANAELRSLHVKGERVVPMAPTCPRRAGFQYTGFGYDLNLQRNPIELTPGLVPRGSTSVAGALRIGQKVVLAVGWFRNANLPRCVSSHGVGPGVGHWVETKANKPNAAQWRKYQQRVRAAEKSQPHPS